MAQDKPQTPREPQAPGRGELLDSWKAIAVYLKRDESTVRRWQKEGLPVHRHQHAKKSTVYAYTSEIDGWWNEAGTLERVETRSGSSRRRLAWSLAAGALVLALAAAWLVDRMTMGEIASIAVLPLANLSGDPQQDYFADGMTEGLINELGKIGALRVVSRTSMMAYRGTKKTLPQVARELNVDALVEGAVVREGGRVRVTARLIRIKPERLLWAERYERDVSSMLVLQRELAHAIAGEIRRQLTPQEQVLLAKARPVDPEAYEAYLKGRYHWNRASAAGLVKARESFEEAIRKDPGFAPAYAGLADTYAWSFRWALVSLQPPEAVFPKAKAAALKALELDDTLAEAHASLAYIKEAYDWDWEGAELEYRRAIELNPNHAGARHSYALYLAIPRRFDEAFAQLRRAEELDPLVRGIKRAKGWLHLWAGQFDRAAEQWQTLLEAEDDFPQAHFNLGHAYARQGRHEEAIAAHRRQIAKSGPVARSLALLAHSHGSAGQTNEALKLIAELNERTKREYVSGYLMGLAYVGVGNNNEALRSLERAFEQRAELGNLARAPFWWDPLRDDPRFQDLLRRLQLPR